MQLYFRNKRTNSIPRNRKSIKADKVLGAWSYNKVTSAKTDEEGRALLTRYSGMPLLSRGNGKSSNGWKRNKKDKEIVDKESFKRAELKKEARKGDR